MAAITAHPTTQSRRRFGPDTWIVVVVCILLLGGLVAVAEAGYAQMVTYHAKATDPTVIWRRQAFFAAFGLAAMCFTLKKGHMTWRNIAPSLLGVAVVLLLLCYVPGMGQVKNGSHRWLKFGAFSFQPSELTKLAIVLATAYVLSEVETRKRKMRQARGVRNWTAETKLLITAFACVALIAKEPDLGTAIIVLLTLFTMMLMGRMKFAYVLIAMVITVSGGLIAYRFLPHAVKRVDVWRNPELYRTGEGAQVIDALGGMGRGQKFGVGIGEGLARYDLPEASSDYIFATIAEEGGVITAVLTVTLLLLLVIRCLIAGIQCADRFGALVCVGIASWLFWQTAINIAVVTNSIPATGVPLPFISNGGTSLMVLLFSVGIVLSVSSANSVARRGARRTPDAWIPGV